MQGGLSFFLRPLRYKNYTVFVTKYYFGSGSSLLPKWYWKFGAEKIKGRDGNVSTPALVSFDWFEYFDDLSVLFSEVSTTNEI